MIQVGVNFDSSKFNSRERLIAITRATTMIQATPVDRLSSEGKSALVMKMMAYQTKLISR